MTKILISGTCFSKGYEELPVKKQRLLREKVKELLHITTDMAFYNYKNGEPEMKVSQAVEVEKLFKSFGVKDCWGKEE